jgi:hypothetical protein
VSDDLSWMAILEAALIAAALSSLGTFLGVVLYGWAYRRVTR